MRSGVGSLARRSLPVSASFRILFVAVDIRRAKTGVTIFLKDGKLLLFTPIDPIFLLIPVLEAVRPFPYSRPLSLFPVLSATNSPYRDRRRPPTPPASFSSTRFSPSPPPAGHPKGKGADASESKGVESEDVHLLGQLEGVERVLRKVCDVQGERTSFSFAPLPTQEAAPRSQLMLSPSFLQKSPAPT
jgi:hypothetical protein